MEKAARVTRLLALLLDVVVMTSIRDLVFIGLGIFFPIDIFLTPIIIASAISALFYFFCVPVLFRTTVGKYVFSLKIIDSRTSGVPSRDALFIRTILLIAWLIEAIILLFSKQNKRIGDKLTCTEVVKKKVTKKFRIATFSATVIFLYLNSFLSSLLWGFAAENSSLYNNVICLLESDITRQKYNLVISRSSDKPHVFIIDDSVAHFCSKLLVNGIKKNVGIEVKRTGNTWIVENFVVLDKMPGRQYNIEYCSILNFLIPALKFYSSIEKE